MILGADFCDKDLQAIRPSHKAIKFDDRTAMQIHLIDLQVQQRLQQRNLGTLHGYKIDNITPSSLIRASATINIPAQS